MKRSILMLLAAVTAVFSIQAVVPRAMAAGQLTMEPDEPLVISDGESSINKVKIMRTPDGTLFAVYGKAQDVNLDGNTLAWEAKGRYLRKPWDIVIKYSLDKGNTWSDPLNIDNTAVLSSSKAVIEPVGPPPMDPESGTPILDGHPHAVTYPGDSDKPNVRNVGNHIVVAWNGKYCEGGVQRYVVYPETYGIIMPYSCQYVSRLVWNSTEKRFNTYEAWGGLPYKTEQLSSGIRDAKQDAHRGNRFGHVLNWQEDPLGLNLGQGEGPGHGASGSNVNHGTDVWYTYLPLLNAAGTGVDTQKFVNGSWAEPSRITRNVAVIRELEGRAREVHPPGLYEWGNVGASRPNIGQVDDYTLIAYEETKSTQGWDEGKYIRYHAFKFDQPPAGGEHGCVISDPWENARRVRFVTQSLTNEVPVYFIYKQGNYTQGGPSDIMFRRAVGGVLPQHLDPPVDWENCRAHITSDTHPMLVIDLEKHGAMNFSGTRFIGDQTGTGSLYEIIDTEANALENALAHRGVMRGNTIVIGYSYTPDVERYLTLNDQAPYNFWVRRSTDAGLTWSDAVNVTPQVTAETGVSVREPRMVPTQASGPRCATDPTDCQNPDVIYVAYGLEENVYSHYQDGADVDLYMMVSMDAGATFSETVAITSGDILGGFPDDFEDYETQIVVRPDGRENYIVWSGTDEVATHTMFRRGRVRGDSVELDTAGGVRSRLTVMPDERSEAIFERAEWRSLDGLPTPPADYDFPYGVLDFTVTQVALGGSIEVVLSFPEPLPAGTVYWKFGPTHESPVDHWYTIPATIEGSTIRYVLTDGENGDADLLVNGVIVDPAAPGIYNPAAVQPPPPAPVPAPSSSSGGCSLGKGDKVDPTLLLLMSLSLWFVAIRRKAAHG